MTEDDKQTIRNFASMGTETPPEVRKYWRCLATEAHRRAIPTDGVRGTPEQDFMAEVDNPAPDLMLRAKYREVLLALGKGE